MILLRRPARFGGALGAPKSRRLERMFVTERSLYRTAVAIRDIVRGSPLRYHIADKLDLREGDYRSHFGRKSFWKQRCVGLLNVWFVFNEGSRNRKSFRTMHFVT